MKTRLTALIRILNEHSVVSATPPATTAPPEITSGTTSSVLTTKASVCERGELVNAWERQELLSRSSYQGKNVEVEEEGFRVHFRRKTVTSLTIDFTNKGQRKEQYVYKASVQSIFTTTVQT